MVDARIPEKRLNDRRLMRLSPVDFRSYVMATVWSVSNRTDGRILLEDLALIPTFDKESASHLVAAELWTRGEAGFVIIDFEAEQTSKSELDLLESNRRREREKKQRQRSKKSVPEDSPQGLSPGTFEGTAQARQGQERQGQAQDYEPSSTSSGDDAVAWPVATIGEGKKAS